MCSMLLRDLLICASSHLELCQIYVTMVTSLQYIRRLYFCCIESRLEVESNVEI